MTNDLTWEQWETKYQHELNEHPANYEIQFVRQCIKPTFVIIIREGVYLPIEIDGLSKMIDYDNTHEERYERFNDFLFRQNEIINRFGTILRYPNKYWLNNPNRVADEIKQNIKRVYFHNKPKEIVKEKIVYKETQSNLNTLNYYPSKHFHLTGFLSELYIYIKKIVINT